MKKSGNRVSDLLPGVLLPILVFCFTAMVMGGCKECNECEECKPMESGPVWQRIQYPAIIPHAVKGTMSLFVRIEDGVVTHTYGHMLQKDESKDKTNYIIRSEPVDESSFPDLPSLPPKKRAELFKVTKPEDK